MSTHTRTIKGFSTIEMLVAVALFAMVVLMSATALITLIEANQKARNIKIAMDNLSFVIDDMSRSLRLGSNYYCQYDPDTPITLPTGGSYTNDCLYDRTQPWGSTFGGQYLAFRDKDGFISLYRFSGGCVQKKTTSVRWGNPFQDDFSGYACMTSTTNMTLTQVRFFVQHTAPYRSNDSTTFAQPIVTLSITGTAGATSKSSVQTTFSLMTSMTQRIPHNAEP